MPRTVEEWIGKDASSAIPPRVKVRIMERQKCRCHGCTRLLGGRLKPEFDHRPALINSGQNRESMIVAVCAECHSGRTKSDLAEKAKVYAVRSKHLGIKPPKRKWGSRSFRRAPSNTKQLNEEFDATRQSMVPAAVLSRD